MQYRPLGATGLRISAVSFGAGPVAALMTQGSDDGRSAAARQATVRQALDAGINWFDTAATYGDGKSERNLGASLAALGALPADGQEPAIHLATKVRLAAEQMSDIRAAVRESFEASCGRLGVRCVTLLQLHNSITQKREDLPTSITPDDVLGPKGVLSALRELQDRGRVRFAGLTLLGHPDALRQVLQGGGFQAAQGPYHLLNPSLGQPPPTGFTEEDHGGLLLDCERLGMGVMAIRVLAGGALAGQPPSQHTLSTRFFPLDLYQRDQRRALRVQAALPDGLTLREAALRFVLSNSAVSSALVGLSTPEEVAEAVRFAAAGPLPANVLRVLAEAAADDDRDRQRNASDEVVELKPADANRIF